MSFGEKLKEMEKSKYPHRVYTGSTAVYTLNKQVDKYAKHIEKI